MTKEQEQIMNFELDLRNLIDKSPEDDSFSCLAMYMKKINDDKFTFSVHSHTSNMNLCYMVASLLEYKEYESEIKLILIDYFIRHEDLIQDILIHVLKQRT